MIEQRLHARGGARLERWRAVALLVGLGGLERVGLRPQRFERGLTEPEVHDDPALEVLQVGQQEG